MKKIMMSIILLLVITLSMSSIKVNASSNDVYKKEYKQDQDLIEEIYANLPNLIEEGRLATLSDAKSITTTMSLASCIGPEFCLEGGGGGSSALGTVGDILVSLIVDSGSFGFAGHAAIVHTDRSLTIESYAGSFSPIGIDGVQIYENNWMNSQGSLQLRPYGASLSDYTTAANYAIQQVGKPYNWNFFNKTTTDAFYCSQLVWLSWLEVGINTETGSPPNGIIAPADLVNSSNTYIVYHVS